jgi:hypothetical protein
MNEKLINELTELFLSKVETKNSWGKNEVRTLYKDCLIKALVQNLGDQIEIMEKV